MALTPMIVIGCGGSGGKVIVGLRQRLEVELRRRGWTEGVPEAWQLLYVDTPGTQEVNIDYGALASRRGLHLDVQDADDIRTDRPVGRGATRTTNQRWNDWLAGGPPTTFPFRSAPAPGSGVQSAASSRSTDLPTWLPL